MKKNDAMYWLFDLQMVPFSKCLSINFWSSSCSVVDSLIVLLMSVAGAPSFSSILWSHGFLGKYFFDSWSLKISANIRYW